MVIVISITLSLVDQPEPLTSSGNIPGHLILLIQYGGLVGHRVMLITGDLIVITLTGLTLYCAGCAPLCLKSH